ncbi:MAG: diguanylate cyclase domain-containing protein, partial [Spirochaetaceae bacterium]
ETKKQLANYPKNKEIFHEIIERNEKTSRQIVDSEERPLALEITPTLIDKKEGLYLLEICRLSGESLYEEMSIESVYGREVFNALPDSIVVLDNHGVVIDINTPFEQFFEFTRQEVCGESLINILVPENQREEARRNAQRVLDDGISLKFDSERLSKSGALRQVEILAFPINIEDDRVGSYVIFNNISERKRREEEIHSLLYTDNLTGLYNRKYAYEKLNQLLESVNGDTGGADATVSLIYIDLDRFKEINDTMGHRAGDAVLTGFADRVKRHFLSSLDLCRIGGDEFLAIVDHSLSAEPFSDEIRALFEKPIIFDGQHILLELSIGIARTPEDGTTIDELITQADIRMYNEKRARRIKRNPIHTQISVDELTPNEGL